MRLHWGLCFICVPFNILPHNILWFFPPKIAVPPKQMVKEVDKSRRTQWILHFQTFTSPSDPQVRLHLLPFDCHFTISSSFFPPPSLTHSLEEYHFWGGVSPCFFTHWYNHIVLFFSFFIPSEASKTFLLDPIRLPCEMIFVSRLTKGNSGPVTAEHTVKQKSSLNPI